MDNSADMQSLEVGVTVRIVLAHGEVTVGKVTSLGPRHIGGVPSSVVVRGRTYRAGTSKISISVVDTSHTVVDAPVIKLTDEEVRDYVFSLERVGYTSKPHAVTVKDIALAALGFDPTVSVLSRKYGGKTDSAYWNEFIKLSAIEKALTRLTESGELVKVTAPSRLSQDQGDRRFVHIHGRTGWVTVAAYAAARAEYLDKVNEAEIAKLLDAARSNVADRHAAEVDEEFERLRREAGL